MHLNLNHVTVIISNLRYFVIQVLKTANVNPAFSMRRD